MQPDYAGHGLLNLVQSLSRACGGPVRYAELAALPAATLAEARHVVFILADGLGQALFDTLPPDAALRRDWRATLSSVFPSTTAAAIGSVMTGLAPAAHGLTGWHVRCCQPQRTLAVLPLTAREAGLTPTPEAAEALLPTLFPYPTLFAQLTRASCVLSPRHLAASPFNRWHSRGAEVLAYDGLADLGDRLVERLRTRTAPEYVYAYHPDIDSLAHRHGWRSPEVAAALLAFDAFYARLVAALQGQDVWLIVSADHGFIDSPAERQISLDDHPELACRLAAPLSGEGRLAYAQVRAGQEGEFAAYVQRHLAHAVELRRSADLVAAGSFGPPPLHPELLARVGDFCLVMRDDWTIKDWLPNERRYRLIGHHGGTRPEEMRIPLVAVRL